MRRTSKSYKCSRSNEGINMIKENLIDKLLEHMCDSVDQQTLLECYSSDQYNYLTSLSDDELKELAKDYLNEEVTLND